MERTASTTRLVEIFGTSVDLEAPSDARALRGYRKSRLHEALVRRDLAAIVLFNPINMAAPVAVLPLTGSISG